MNTWNTITTNGTSPLEKAISLLEILCHENSIPIIEYLLENANATFLDLSINTRLDSFSLDTQLELLCMTRLVRQSSSICSSYYYLNHGRLARVKAIAGQLADRPRE